jgi:ubiquinone/menaquinone biosynthesis C-methylase UbiE
MTLDDLQRLLWEFARHRVVTVAARTGLLSRLAQRPAATAEAARDLGLDPLATAKIVRALAAIGIVAADGERYRVVETLAPMFGGGADDLTPFVAHSHSMYEAWGENLEPWLRGEPWGTRDRGPEGVRAFGAAMRAIGGRIARRVAEHLDIGNARRMLDLGGGFGQYSVALCTLHPGLHATVLDVPEVVEVARRELTGSGFEDRIDFIGGDYHSTEVGGGYDLVLLANILHQEPVPQAAALVRRAAETLIPGGRVAMVDFQIDDDQREHPFGTLFAINMRSFGDTHTEPTIRSWMEAAGLNAITRTDLDPDRWLIVGRKP